MDLSPSTEDDYAAVGAREGSVTNGPGDTKESEESKAERSADAKSKAERSTQLPTRGKGRLTTRARTLLTLLIATSAAVAVATARGAPTQNHSVDMTLKVVLGLACVLAGGLTPWPLVALAAAVAAAASFGSPAALVAVAIFGVALGSWWAAAHHRRTARRPHHLAPRRFRVLGAACGGALAGLAVRASWPHANLEPSALAALVVILVLVPGIVAAPRRARRSLLGVCGLLAFAVVLLSAVAGVTIYEARTPLRSALAEARAGLAAAEQGNQPAAVSEFKSAVAALRTAQHDLRWARTAEVVPVVSQQVRAVETAVSAGESLAQAGVTTASTASVQNLRLVNGTFPIRRLEALRPVFRRDAGILATVTRETSAFSSPWIVAPLRSKLSSIDSRLALASHDARIGLLASEEIPRILGAGGLRTYLLLVENPAESRASGGIVGDYAELTADAGHLRLVKVGSVGQLNSDGVPPQQRSLPPIPDYLDRYGAYFPQDRWENVPMSPDFPTVGAVAAYLYPQSGGVKVNGVISVDPVAMAGFLGIVGPVTAAGSSQLITQSNVVSFLANQEFVQFTNNELRINFLAALLKEVWHELTSRPLPAVPTLVKDLGPAVRGGHLLMYSSSPREEALFRQVGTAGEMRPVHGDFVGVVTENAGANKIDWYLRRTISYAATLDLPTYTISSALTVRLRNTAPSSGLPAVIIDGGPHPGENLTWVNVYTPWRLVSATLDGRPLTMTSQYELGRQVYSAVIGIPSERTDTLKLLLTGTWPRSLSHYRLGWYHQPMLFPDQVSSTVRVIR